MGCGASAKRYDYFAEEGTSESDQSLAAKGPLENTSSSNGKQLAERTPNEFETAWVESTVWFANKRILVDGSFQLLQTDGSYHTCGIGKWYSATRYACLDSPWGIWVGERVQGIIGGKDEWMRIWSCIVTSEAEILKCTPTCDEGTVVVDNHAARKHSTIRFANKRVLADGSFQIQKNGSYHTCGMGKWYSATRYACVDSPWGVWVCERTDTLLGTHIHSCIATDEAGIMKCCPTCVEGLAVFEEEMWDTWRSNFSAKHVKEVLETSSDEGVSEYQSDIFEMDPCCLCYSQPSASKHFKNGRPVQTLIDELKGGRVDPLVHPELVLSVAKALIRRPDLKKPWHLYVPERPCFWTLNHRRLFAMKAAGCRRVRCQITLQGRKFDEFANKYHLEPRYQIDLI